MEVKISPQIEALLSRAEDCLSQQKPTRAKAILNEAEALATTPDERSAVLDLFGQTLIELGHYPQAERRLRKAILASPYGACDAVMNLFFLYQTTRRPWEALVANLEALHMVPAETPFLANILFTTGNLYAELGFPELAVQHYRRALREFEALSPDADTINDCARRLRETEHLCEESGRDPHITRLLAELRDTEHGQGDYGRCMDQLSDLHLAQNDTWMSLLCAIEVLSTHPEPSLWQKHQRRAAKLWAVRGDVEFSFIHFREVVTMAMQHQDMETVRSFALEIFEALQPTGFTEKDLTMALRRLPEGHTGEFLLDILYSIYRISKT